MIEQSKANDIPLDYYILNDQPTTCGLCGSRTSFDEAKDGSQIHQCLNIDCGYKFIAMEDID